VFRFIAEPAAEPQPSRMEIPCDLNLPSDRYYNFPLHDESLYDE
jgi:hypothetical protein